MSKADFEGRMSEMISQERLSICASNQNGQEVVQESVKSLGFLKRY